MEEIRVQGWAKVEQRKEQLSRLKQEAGIETRIQIIEFLDSGIYRITIPGCTQGIAFNANSSAEALTKP